MKRINPLIIIAIVAISTALFFLLKSHNNEVRREPITDAFVFYIDGKQLITKSGIEQHFSEDNRKFLATIATSELETTEYNEHIIDIAANPDNTGLWLSHPIYAYANSLDLETFDGVVIVEVSDITKLDTTINLLKDIADAEGEYLDVKVIGDTRYFTCDELIGGYNKSHLAISFDTDNNNNIIRDALSRPLSDLEMFKGYDMAAYIDLNKVIDMQEKSTMEYIKELKQNLDYSDYDYEIEIYESQIAQSEELLMQLSDMRNSLRDDASLITSLNFEAGQVRLAIDTEGVTFSGDILKELKNEHLKYIDEEVISLINYNIDGTALSQYLNDNMPSDIATTLGVSRNEFGMGLQIALDALSSINGEVTLALLDLNGAISKRYSYYNNNYLELNSVKAMMLTDVTDRYIIDNISRFGGSIFDRTEDGILSIQLDENNVCVLGQQEGLLYAGINASLQPSPNPATAASWYKDINNNLGYFVLNINSMLYSSYVDAAYNRWLDDMSSSDERLVREIVSSLDYLYHRIDKKYNNELVLVFKDRESNALKQLTDPVVNYVMQEINY